MLIGRIGESGELFAVGSFRGTIADSAGRLYLGMNDGYPGDATGFFVVVIYRVQPYSGPAGLEDLPGTDEASLMNHPNPFQSSTSIILSAPMHEAYDVKITDVQGRLVRAFSPIAPGSGPVHWDGRDDSGTTVASGVYFVRARSEGGATYERRINFGPLTLPQFATRARIRTTKQGCGSSHWWPPRPLGKFSGQMLEKIRHFHVLNGQDIRSYAARYVREF